MSKTHTEKELEDIAAIADALVNPCRDQYDVLRLSLIIGKGYNEFRDLQCAAFEKLFGNV